MVLSYNDIINELKKKIYRPIYLLMGDEPYFIDKITEYLTQNVLKPEERDFNQSVFYGKDTNASDLDNYCRRFPMMANHQMIIIKEAQELKDFDNLVYYAKKPLSSTILVINYKYKNVDKKKKVYKELEANGVVFESKKMYDNQVADWIKTYITEKGYTLEHEVGPLLTEFLGTDLGKIVNELEKLTLNLPANTKITTDIVAKNIGISKDYSNFELQNALVNKDILKANRIINYFGANQKDNPIIVTIITLFNFFSKLLIFQMLKDKTDKDRAALMKINPYFLKDYKTAAQKYNTRKVAAIISILREYDARSKGIGNASDSPADLLKEMIFKILH